MYFWNFGDFQVVGASPEILVRQERIVDNGVPKSQITIRPLAGTRKRGATPEEDAALAAELKADPKEVAEHVMLIDLARNDVGRVAEVGSVKVSDTMVIERYSHVMHLVSNVTGTLNPGMSSMDVLRASFPAGTLTGAPKVEAMKLIDELEPVRRGIYGGAAGYLSYGGEMDVAIAIRTGVIKDGTLYVQAAAGIVADSIRKPNGPRPKPRPAPCCARPSRCSTAWTNPSERAPTTDTTSGAGPGSPGEKNMLLMIDNYDSFTYNLVQYFGELGEDVRVARNDQITLEEIAALNPDRICVSPGPSSPAEAGISVPVIQAYAGKKPILGVCLGHQAIGAAFGGDIVRAQQIMHGKTVRISHTGTDIFTGLPTPYTVIRYNSLTIDPATLPDCLAVTATAPDGDIMGVRHKTLPLYGVQFHPESVLSEHGHALLRNFLNLA